MRSILPKIILQLLSWQQPACTGEFFGLRGVVYMFGAQPPCYFVAIASIIQACFAAPGFTPDLIFARAIVYPDLQACGGFPG